MSQKGLPVNQAGQIQILIGILILAIVAGGAYFLGKSNGPKSSTPLVSQAPKPIPSSTSDASPAPNNAEKTTNWKTYTNTKLGFSLKYPPNWKSGDDGSYFSAGPDVPLSPGENEALSSSIGVFVSDNNWEKSIGEYVKQTVGPSWPYREPIIIDGSEGIKIYDYEDDPNDIDGFIFIKHRSRIYKIDLSNSGSTPERRINLNTYDQILSTFKFTN